MSLQQLASALCLLALLGSSIATTSPNLSPGGRIFSGIATREGDLPFILKIIGSDGGIIVKTSNRCTSVLIHPRWILTAAHCKTDDFTYKIYVNSPPETGETTIYVPETDWTVHPFYKDENGDTNATADLALIHVHQDIPVTPIHIANFSTDPFPYLKNVRGAMVTAAGYGYIDKLSTVQAKTLRKTFMFLEKRCPLRSGSGPAFYSRYDGDREPMFCVRGGPGIEGICSEDSGGPVLFEELKSRIVFGIISSGVNRACDFDKPFHYPGPWREVHWIVRISWHLEWIQGKMCEKGDRLDYMDYQCP